jgi:hypothetical protein
LFSWVFFFMDPSHPVDLFLYSIRDLLQLQHIAIAALLFSGGLIEVLQSCYMLPPMSQVPSPSANAALNSNSLSPAAVSAALTASRTGSYWHVLWSSNLILTGLIFMLHPQHTYSATVKHLLLGTSLVLGSPLLVRGKLLAWKLELEQQRRQAQGLTAPWRNNHVDWSMIAAGGSFALAACILLAFREHETEVHLGTEKTCQPSFVVCVIAYICASCSTVAASVVAFRQHQRDQRARGESATSCCSRAFLSDVCVTFYRRRIRGWTSLVGGDASADGSEDVQNSSSPAGNGEYDAATRRRAPDEAREVAEEDIELAAASPSSNHALRSAYSLNGSSAPSSTNGSHANGRAHSKAVPLPAPLPSHAITASSLPPPASSSSHTLGSFDASYNDDDDDEPAIDAGHAADAAAFDDLGLTEEEQRERERDRRRQEEWTGEEEA